MKLLLNDKQIPEFKKGTVVTIGNFDGVHLGHQQLIKRVSEMSKKKALPSVLMLFEPQPSEYFLKDNAPARISTLREKLCVISKSAIDYVYCLRFNKKIAMTEAVDFACSCIFASLNARYMVLGRDFKFGKNRSGDMTLINRLAEKNACQVEAFTDFEIHGQRISSTEIRKALKENRLDKARELMGRPYQMTGRVVHGDGRGRQWGIPTANLNISRLSIPLSGVFCVHVTTQSGNRYNGVANLGRRPTVNGQRIVLEVHLFAFNRELYGERLVVEFIHKLRDEVKFSSIDVLIQQIKQDVKTAEQFFLTL